jgi:hypothetical protein
VPFIWRREFPPNTRAVKRRHAQEGCARRGARGPARASPFRPYSSGSCRSYGVKMEDPQPYEGGPSSTAKRGAVLAAEEPVSV